MPKIDLICLANSYKLNHRCIAGLRADGNGWIRPVAGTGQGELEYRHYRLRDGSEPKPLDIVRIGLSTPIEMILFTTEICTRINAQFFGRMLDSVLSDWCQSGRQTY